LTYTLQRRRLAGSHAPPDGMIAVRLFGLVVRDDNDVAF
jgi:hypothetical protein